MGSASNGPLRPVGHCGLQLSSSFIVAAAICELLPLDYFEEPSAFYMTPQEGVSMPPKSAEVINELAVV